MTSDDSDGTNFLLTNSSQTPCGASFNHQRTAIQSKGHLLIQRTERFILIKGHKP